LDYWFHSIFVYYGPLGTIARETKFEHSCIEQGREQRTTDGTLGSPEPVRGP